MCGIVGVISKRCLFKRAFASLGSLEYRGYDSFGFGAIVGNEVKLKKKVGAVSETLLSEFEGFDKSNTILGHTRWATHGVVTSTNSHPHGSQDGSVYIVHNGVISNFTALMALNPHWLLTSDTDTEIAANVISDALNRTDGQLVKALANAMRTLEGEFAICGILPRSPNCMFAMKRKSPLCVGMLEDGVVFSSDSSSFSSFANSIEVLQLEDDEIFIYNEDLGNLYKLTKSGLQIISRKPEVLVVKREKNDLGPYPHYMIKEIHEAPSSILNVMNSLQKNKDIIVDEIMSSNVTMTGSGSAYYVTLIGQYYFHSIAGKYVPTHPSDEYLNLRIFSQQDLLLTVSQSGETFDVLEVLRNAKSKGATLVAINNVENSSMQRIADFPIYQNAGREVCVLSTKSLISQATALYCLATEVGRRSGHISEKNYVSLMHDTKELPLLLQNIITDYSDAIKYIAIQYSGIEHWFFIGRGIQYAVALESALKFKEVSYLHAEAMPAGFFKHGTISLIDSKFYTIIFLPSSISDPELFQSSIDNVHEIRARGGNVIGIGHTHLKDTEGRLFKEYIVLPDLNNHLNAIIQLICGQLLSYYCAEHLGRNIDRPRALAKSVTVR